ncbi:hypothetical protein AMTRI_Chr06g174500 [Amborella trichopoda]
MITLLFAFFLRSFRLMQPQYSSQHSLSKTDSNLRASNSSSASSSDSVSGHEFPH